jgi:cold shock CspA family protein
MKDNHKGVLKRWNEEKGFGFIQSSSHKSDIFIHISAFKNDLNRRPLPGDILYYQIHTDNNGKKRAVNARIEGVSAQNSPKRERVRKVAESPNHAANWILLVLLIFGGLFIYNKFFNAENITPPIEAANIISPTFSTTVTSAPPLAEEYFECDGRQYCSQMNSRDEALFFIRTCPNTKMDGDHDGNPCENDSRF